MAKRKTTIRKKAMAKTKTKRVTRMTKETANTMATTATKAFKPIEFSDNQKFEPIMPRIAGRLAPEEAKLDKFEKFAKVIRRIQESAKARIAEKKRTFFLRWFIIIVLILLGINLIWILTKII